MRAYRPFWLRPCRLTRKTGILRPEGAVPYQPVAERR